MSETQPRDKVLRAMTDDGSFRVLVAETTETVAGIVAAQEVGDHAAVEMSAIVTGAVLVRETMAPANRVQMIYTDARGSQLVGDAFPEGRTRGLARIQDPVLGVDVGEGGVMRVERVMQGGRTHQGFVQTEAGEDLVTTLRKYFQRSEQVTSMVDLACTVRDGVIRGAAGYVVQLLPELTDPPLVAMNERLERFGSLAEHVAAHGAHPALILQALLAGVDHTMLADSPVMFHCQCDRDRVRGAAAALGAGEIQDLLIKELDLKVTCDYCREEYTLGVMDYRRILDDTQG